MNYDYMKNREGRSRYAYGALTDRIRVAATSSPLVKYQLLENLRHIVEDIRKGTIVFDAEELVPKMLQVGRTRGTADYERAVRDLLATLAKKIPSSKYSEDFEEYI
jgi:hypothetical protein